MTEDSRPRPCAACGGEPVANERTLTVGPLTITASEQCDACHGTGEAPELSVQQLLDRIHEELASGLSPHSAVRVALYSADGWAVRYPGPSAVYVDGEMGLVLELPRETAPPPSSRARKLAGGTDE